MTAVDITARRILARNVRRLRQLRDLSQEELADAAGVRQAQVSEIESGKSKVGRLAAALDAKLADLFDETKRGLGDVLIGLALCQCPDVAVIPDKGGLTARIHLGPNELVSVVANVRLLVA